MLKKFQIVEYFEFGNFILRTLNLNLFKIPMQNSNGLLSAGTTILSLISEVVFLSIPIKITVVIYWMGGNHTA